MTSTKKKTFDLCDVKAFLFQKVKWDFYTQQKLQRRHDMTQVSWIYSERIREDDNG